MRSPAERMATSTTFPKGIVRDEWARVRTTTARKSLNPVITDDYKDQWNGAVGALRIFVPKRGEGFTLPFVQVSRDRLISPDGTLYRGTTKNIVTGVLGSLSIREVSDPGVLLERANGKGYEGPIIVANFEVPIMDAASKSSGSLQLYALPFDTGKFYLDGSMLPFTYPLATQFERSPSAGIQ